MKTLRKNTYIISDLHFNHRNIIKYCHRNYDFENVDDVARMNDDMLRMFDTLPRECDVINCGDLFFSGTSIDDMKSIVDYMKHGKNNDANRRLTLICGNHDMKKLNGSRIDFYKSIGFDDVYDTPIIVEGNIILSHEPVYIDGETFINFHGHTHDVNVDKEYFMHVLDNFKMIERVCEIEKIEKPQDFFADYRPVNVNQYHNICLDSTHSFVKLK